MYNSIRKMDNIANELHKPVRRKFQRRRVVVSRKNDTWSADLVDMNEWKNKNKGFRYILTVMDIGTRYAWAYPLKTKGGVSMSEKFKQLFQDEGASPDKLWVDQGSEF